MQERSSAAISVARFAADPWAALGALFSETDPPGEACRLVASCATAAREWRDAERQQGLLSRRIGRARREGLDPAEPLARMRAVSARRKSIEGELAETLERLRALAEDGDRDAGDERTDGTVARPAYFGGTFHRGDRSEDVFDLIDRPDAGRWDAFVAAHPARTAAHVHRFGTVAELVYGCRAHRLAATDAGGAIAGVLPMIELDHRLFGRALVSLPWINYGGPLAATPGAGNALMRGAAALASRIGCPELEVREAHSRSDWPALSHKVSMTLALPSTDDALESVLGTKLRAQCAKAARAGATYRSGGIELLDGFHRVMSINMRDLGTPFHPKRFFAELLHALDGLARVALVEIGGRPVAAALLLSHANTLEISWASALRSARAADPNMFLYRCVLREAIERGHDVFDFGRSSPGAPTHAFKRQWGATERALHWHYWRADGSGAPNLDADRAKFDLAVALWKRLPVSVSRTLGPWLSRGLR